jgi:AcrR family transcriptional regulator
VTTATEKPYAGKSAVQRQTERRARLIDACYDLMGSGEGGISVRSVCQASGLTSRYFYESFSSLDELLVAVFDGVMAATSDRFLAAWAKTDGSIAGSVNALAIAFVEMTLDDPRAMTIGFKEAWNSEALMRRRVTTLHGYATNLAETVAKEAGIADQRHPTLDVAAFVVIGGLLEATLGWLDGDLHVTRDEFLDGFTRTATASLVAAVAS